MITISQQKIIANSQIFECTSINLTKFDAGWSAQISFEVKSETGIVIDTILLTYTGKKWDSFWANFNSGKFLFEELLKIEGLTASIPDTIEQDFTN